MLSDSDSESQKSDKFKMKPVRPFKRPTVKRMATFEDSAEMAKLKGKVTNIDKKIENFSL